MNTTRIIGFAAALAVGLTACTGSPGSKPTPEAPVKTLTVVTHDSFSLSDEVKAKFEEDTGYRVKYVGSGSSGQMVNQLVLTKDSPLGDVVVGIDNTFAGRAITEGVLERYVPKALPPEAEGLAADDSGMLTPIDFGDVCVNADSRWFANHDLAVPETLANLVKPEYADMLVVQNPASSSPGLSFLLTTIAVEGDGYLDYWRQLKDNGVKITRSWTEAYNGEFTAGEGKGKRPLVVSYSTSPSYHVVDGETTTAALLGTCFRQVEYAGVIAGTKDESGAQAFVDFLLSPEVQADIPGQMYMYPAMPGTPLPEEWVRFAPLTEEPVDMPASEIAKNRDTWIRDWTDAIIG